MKIRSLCMLCVLVSLGVSAMAGAQSSPYGNSRDGEKDLLSIGHDATLASGHEADSVVSIMGTTRVAGHDRADAVAVFGDVIVDGKVDGDVVAVVGDVTLGPTAEVDGDVVTVLGGLQRDPAAIVNGSIHSVFDRDFGPVGALRAWIKHCVLYARPLAFAPGLTWAWGLAGGFLAVYALLALVLPGTIGHCVRTFDENPGASLLAAFIGILLTPLLFLLLCMTVIGIPTIPFVATGLLCAGLFGKAVVLAWIGSRLLGSRLLGGRRQDSAAFFPLAVLVGGLGVLLLYVIPVVGLLAFQLLGILGFGAVINAVLMSLRNRRSAAALGDPPAARPSSAGSSTATFAEAGSSDAAPSDPASSDAAPEVAAASVSLELPHAGFWIRMAALFLDAVLVGFITSLLRHAVHLQLVLLAIYGAVMWQFRGATLGGIIFDLKVVRLDGRPMNWETAIVRALGCFLSLAIAGLGFVWIAFDGAKQAWHDKIAGTVVVRVPRVPAGPQVLPGT